MLQKKQLVLWNQSKTSSRYIPRVILNHILHIYFLIEIFRILGFIIIRHHPNLLQICLATTPMNFFHSLNRIAHPSTVPIK